MKTSMRLALLLSAAPAIYAETALPLVKVVKMLQGMVQKGEQDRNAEQVQFAAYKQWCDDSLAAKAKAVDFATQQQSLLQASVQVAGATASSEAAASQEFDTSITKFGVDLKSGDDARKSERSLFEATHKVYTDAIAAVDQALAVLSNVTSATFPKQALSLIASINSVQAAEARQVVAAFLKETTADVALVQQAPGQKLNVGAVREMLQRLRAKFIDERAALEKEELSRQSAYLLQQQGLKAALDSASKQKSASIQAKAAEEQIKAQKTAQLLDVKRTLADDKKYVEDITAECKLKAADYATRQEIRRQEIETIKKAIDLLGLPAIKAAQAAVPVAVAASPAPATALLSVRVVVNSPSQKKAAAFLHTAALRLKSQALSTLAIEAAKDPFIKVRQMIQDLIVHLESQAGAESKKQKWCDTEFASNEQARNSSAVNVKLISTEVEELKSQIAKLSLDMDNIAKQQAETDKSLAAQQKIRVTDQTGNQQTLQDAKEAQVAIASALVLLRQFYQSVGVTSLVQGGEKAPTFAAGSYAGQQGDGRAVISMLEVIQANYARLEASTTAAEKTAQQAADKIVEDSTILKKQLSLDLQRKTTERASKQQQVLDRSRDLGSGQKELEAAQEYYEKLKTSCLSPAQDEADKKIRREAEIQSLQQALSILNSQQ